VRVVCKSVELGPSGAFHEDFTSQRRISHVFESTVRLELAQHCVCVQVLNADVQPRSYWAVVIDAQAVSLQVSIVAAVLQMHSLLLTGGVGVLPVLALVVALISFGQVFVRHITGMSLLLVTMPSSCMLTVLCRGLGEDRARCCELLQHVVACREAAGRKFAACTPSELPLDCGSLLFISSVRYTCESNQRRHDRCCFCMATGRAPVHS
jgi:hypothetical protein